MDLLRSLPIGLYLEKPETWLHKLDARVKLIWLMSFLATPLLANPYWRLSLVGVLIILTLSAAIPLRVWRQQMGWLLAFCALLLVITCITPDGLAVNYSPRLPQSDIEFVNPTDYQYVLITCNRSKIRITGIRITSPFLGERRRLQKVVGRGTTVIVLRTYGDKWATCLPIHPPQ